MNNVQKVAIRPYRPEDHRAIADIFHDTIHEVGPAYYTPAQCEAWAPTPVDYPAWAERLERKQPFVAVQHGTVVGFIELDPDGHIDCMYTHKNHQRQGIASVLYAHLLTAAHDRGLGRLYVEASHFARPFFEKQGFQVVRAQEVPVRGQVLQNFLMERELPSGSNQY